MTSRVADDLPSIGVCFNLKYTLAIVLFINVLHFLHANLGHIYLVKFELYMQVMLAGVGIQVGIRCFKNGISQQHFLWAGPLLTTGILQLISIETHIFSSSG